uniref:NADH-ubiquinone oxidoreductase chain 5 n=1 Tax=Embiophila sp. TaxID=2931291 RepID=A0A8T9ZZZ1_9HEMI|nr:NADH dehydrogenase subunit 5 [Embiophila sp.]
MSFYIFSSMVVFLLGLLFFVSGVLFLVSGLSIFLDWELVGFNTLLFVMTFIFDWISLIFSGCVMFISSMVIFYSHSYMGGDPNRSRFLFLVLLFVLSMFMLIISPNLISILIGWDGLGLVSYGLVIYFQNYKSYNAGMLTVLTNRLGDAAILISIAWLMNYGSWNYIFYLSAMDSWVYWVIGFVILAGFTSSAQIPFSAWLPAAMAAPTPVSALVHSSTLVTAGVYLLIRFSGMLSGGYSMFFVLVGFMTMLMSGVGAIFEYDLKSIIALSTLSQLGLMMGILFLGFSLVSYFHLLAHAFFSALLFLCAGVIIHAMGDSQDIRHMGGVVYYMPWTCACFCISNMALCGIPFMAGFYSKDFVVEVFNIYDVNFLNYVICLFAVGLTSCYTVRLLYYCVFSSGGIYVFQPLGEDLVMSFSMLFLSFLSIVGGSILSWLIFGGLDVLLVDGLFKLFPLMFVILGGGLGLAVSLSLVPGYYLSSVFLGSMWFMPFISVRFVNLSNIVLVNTIDTFLDSGWGEYFISSLSPLYLGFASKGASFYQLNSIKLFFISMVLFVLLGLM